MIQLPEPCDENSDAYKSGYSTICDIGKERIRRIIRRMLEGGLIFKVRDSRRTEYRKNNNRFMKRKAPPFGGAFVIQYILIVQMSQNVEHCRNWNFACVAA